MKISVLDRATLGSDIPLDLLNAYGETVVYDSTTPDQLAQRICDSEILVLNKVKLGREELALAHKLKLVCITATGYDNVDIRAAEELGVAVTNVPGYSTDSVALFTLATVLSLVTHLREYNDYVISGEYTSSGVANCLTPVYHEIRGMTWGMIGYGNIGRAVGRIATAMGAEILVCKRQIVDDARCVGIEELCRRSDIITIHCPLNEQTRGMINDETIALMKPGVVLVNEARGAVVDSRAVCRALKEGRIGGFGSDVYSTEPLSKSDPLYGVKNERNVLLTPHSAWGSFESRKRCVEMVGENIAAYLRGEFKNRVDIPGQK